MMETIILILICSICILFLVSMLKSLSSAKSERINIRELISKNSNEKPTASWQIGVYDEVVSCALRSKNGNIDVTSIIDAADLSSRRARRKSFLQICITLAVSLGLLGTFIGLNDAIKGISTEQLTEGTEVTVGTIKLLFDEPIKGMKTAFRTSIWGLIASLIMTIVFNWCMPRITQSEEMFCSYLENHVVPRHQKEVGISAEITNKLTAITRNMETLVAGVVTELSKAMAEQIDSQKQVMSSFCVVTGELVNSTNSLNDSINKLPQIVEVIDRLEKRTFDNAHQFKELMVTTSEATRQYLVATEAAKKVMVETQNTVDKLERLLSGTIKEVGEAINTQVFEMGNKLESSTKGIFNATGKLNEAINDNAIVMKSIETACGDMVKIQDAINNYFTNLPHEVQAAAAAMDGFPEKMSNLANVIMAANQHVAIEVSNSLSNTISESLSKALSEALSDVPETLMNSLGNALSGLNEQIAQQQRLVTQLSSSLSDALKTHNASLISAAHVSEDDDI